MALPLLSQENQFIVFMATSSGTVNPFRETVDRPCRVCDEVGYFRTVGVDAIFASVLQCGCKFGRIGEILNERTVIQPERLG